MTCSELIADFSLTEIFIRLKLGMASSIRMSMMLMTISNSISVKPLGRWRRVVFRKSFIGVQSLKVKPKSWLQRRCWNGKSARVNRNSCGSKMKVLRGRRIAALRPQGQLPDSIDAAAGVFAWGKFKLLADQPRPVQ